MIWRKVPKRLWDYRICWVCDVMWLTFNLESDLEFIDEFQNVVSNLDIPEAEEQFQGDARYDLYINMKVSLPHGLDRQMQLVNVAKCKRGPNGMPIGIAYDNPMLNT